MFQLDRYYSADGLFTRFKLWTSTMIFQHYWNKEMLLIEYMNRLRNMLVKCFSEFDTAQEI